MADSKLTFVKLINSLINQQMPEFKLCQLGKEKGGSSDQRLAFPL